MKPEYGLGDVLIKRVSNGWIAVTGNEHHNSDSNDSMCYVYRDTDSDSAVAESLYELLIDQFGCYIQSKRQPGLKIEYSTLTKEQEEELDYLTKNQKNIKKR